jgi:SAM-dependent methyltransferase
LAETYGYIPLPKQEWAPSFEAARLATPGQRFLDVGCGTGTKVLRAQRAGFDAWGLEIRPRYAALARRLGAQVIDGDARVWAGYADFDVVFLFHLLKEYDAEADLERRVMCLMRSGALLILYGVVEVAWEAVGPHVWMKP